MNQDVIAGLLGPWSAELGLGAILLRAALSVLFSAVIGCERSSKRHSAGLRTFILVSITGTAAMLTDRLLMELAGVPVPALSAAALIFCRAMRTFSVMLISFCPPETYLKGKRVLYFTMARCPPRGKAARSCRRAASVMR